MTDPVSEELARRAAEPIPWRGALLVALALHLSAFAALLVASRPSTKALSLPAVRVHLAPMPVAPGTPSPAASQQSPARLQAAPPAPKPSPKPAKPTQVAAASVGKSVAKEKPSTMPAPEASASVTGAQESPRTGQAGEAGGGLGLAGEGVEGPPFPYQYYLERVLAAIEQNWFKPPAPPATRCRVRCRIARSGELKEAGLEEPSGHGAFDRAALRAVYAAAPFPPLPQGFGGSELILHLEFVQ